MQTYTFKNMEEFVKYIDDHAATARRLMAAQSPRSHEYRFQWGVATAYEDLGRVARGANIVCVDLP